MYCAYIHARPDGRPFYVGKGTVKRARRLSGRNNHHAKVVSKHGAANILIGMVECSSEEIAFDLEKGMIKCFRRSGVEITNFTDGGEGVSGLRHSDSVREAQRQRMLAEAKTNSERFANLKVANIGRIPSEETRAKMRDAHTRRTPDSEETRAKKAAGRTGKIASKETREKISEAGKKRVITDETRAKLSAAVKQSYINNPGLAATRNRWKGGT